MPRWILFAGLALLSNACLQSYDVFTTEPAGEACLPGQSRACSGDQACSGFQVCNPDGLGFSSCDCSGGSGGSSSSSSSNGAGGSASSGSGGGSSSSSGVGGAGSCGDGAINTGEGCDDGGMAPGDGCDGSCMVEGQGDLCPTGINIQLGAAGIVIADTTVGKGAGNATTCGGNTASDVVYRVTPSQDGTLAVSISGDYDMVLAVRDACPGGGGDTFCLSGAGPLSDTANVQQGNDVFVVVSGVAGANGNYTLQLGYN